VAGARVGVLVTGGNASPAELSTVLGAAHGTGYLASRWRSTSSERV
jgi:hypothetical protein